MLATPVYLFHRYQLRAPAKVVGRPELHLRGSHNDSQTVADIVPAAEQRRALDAILKTIEPAALTVPERILKLLPPHPPEFEPTREDFHSRTQITFDSAAPVEAAADMAISMLLNPERATRLIDYHSRDTKNPGLDEVIDRLITSAWKTPQANAHDAETERTIGNVLLYRIMALAQSAQASEQARAIAFLKLDDLRKWTIARQTTDTAERAHLVYAAAQIKRFEEDPKIIPVAKPVDPPDGSPNLIWPPNNIRLLSSGPQDASRASIWATSGSIVTSFTSSSGVTSKSATNKQPPSARRGQFSGLY